MSSRPPTAMAPAPLGMMSNASKSQSLLSPLRSAEEFYLGTTLQDILAAQKRIRWADHVLIIYPVWHGHFPGLVHAFLEQTFRSGFAVDGG
jgi:putative NADPH-quinone reductase